MDDDTSLYFSSNGRTFSIPRPLMDGGYTEKHLSTIEGTLEHFDLELFPLDHNLLN